jgi:hypothetical protein
LQLRHSAFEANGYANDGYFALIGAQIYAGFEATLSMKIRSMHPPEIKHGHLSQNWMMGKFTGKPYI